MNYYRIKKTFHDLPRNHKYITVGSALALLGTIMPWYEDQDPYGGNQIFYGVDGPLYFIGILILLMAGFTLISCFTKNTLTQKLHLPLSQRELWLICGAQSLLLIITAITIYFHPNFGLDIYIKQTRFGLFVSLVGIVLYTVSAYRELKSPQTHDPEATPQPNQEVFDIRPHTRIAPSHKIKTSTEKPIESENLTLDL